MNNTRYGDSRARGTSVVHNLVCIYEEICSQMLPELLFQHKLAAGKL